MQLNNKKLLMHATTPTYLNGIMLGEKSQSFFAFFLLFQPHPWHMEVPGPETESEPQLQPTWQQRQCQILNLLNHSRNSRKKAVLKDFTLYDCISMTFSGRQNYRDAEKISGWQGSGVRWGRIEYKGTSQGTFRICLLSWLWSWLHKFTHVLKTIELYTKRKQINCTL